MIRYATNSKTIREIDIRPASEFFPYEEIGLLEYYENDLLLRTEFWSKENEDYSSHNITVNEFDSLGRNLKTYYYLPESSEPNATRFFIYRGDSETVAKTYIEDNSGIVTDSTDYFYSFDQASLLETRRYSDGVLTNKESFDLDGNTLEWVAWFSKSDSSKMKYFYENQRLSLEIYGFNMAPEF